MTGTCWRIDNLVVEHREVERQAQANGMCRLHLALADVECLLVRLLRVLNYRCSESSITVTINPTITTTEDTNGTRVE